MDTAILKRFAQGARRQLLEQVSARMEQVLRTDSVEIREKAKVVEELKAQIDEHGKKKVMDRVAYTWFNRFCALRFMDVNHYTRIGAVSPVEGFTQPEVLQEAKQGHIDEELGKYVNRQVVFDLLGGRRPSSDAQGEAYRLLLVGICNYYGEFMPFLFEKIQDYTELLMPLDLLSENSVLYDLRQALTPEACQDVEVIGWLYQYYISERKDEVFEALKKNQKIEAHDIPAATQLFTPHWIVRYLVENSLGRLWMLNHPSSRLREKMEYYIDPRVTASAGEALSSDSVSLRAAIAANQSPRTGVIASEAKQSPGDEGIDSGKEQERPRNDTTAGVTAGDSEAVSSQQEETDFLQISSPEEIKILDPACGSGHMLTYAFDLLYAIYEEEGYASNDIPKSILEKNLFGVEIDPRAGALAAFALTMKARARDRRFFTRNVSPNICVLENVTFNDAELRQYITAVGRDLFTEPLIETLRQFEQADNFGSLIRPTLTDAGYVRGLLKGKNLGGDLFLYGVHERVLKVLKFAEFLAPRYHVMVANPPYMGGGGMNDELREFSKVFFPNTKSDLGVMFIERNLELLMQFGNLGMITMQSWMFLTSYEEFRAKLLNNERIVSMAHLGPRAFDSIGGEIVSTTAFLLQHSSKAKYPGIFFRLVSGENEASKSKLLRENIPSSQDEKPEYCYRFTPADFKKIPGCPIAYWITKGILETFTNNKKTIGDLTISDGQTKTGDNDKFLRQYWEIGSSKVGINKKWCLHPKGGTFRKWYGNVDWVIDWSEEARNHYREDHVARILPEYLWGKPGFSWTLIASVEISFRVLEKGQIFNLAAPSLFFHDEGLINPVLGLLNSKYVAHVLRLINPTTNTNVGEVQSIPFLDSILKCKEELETLVGKCILISKNDWDSSETSWGFLRPSLLENLQKQKSLSDNYNALKLRWTSWINELKQLEEKNNQIIINGYRLQNELTPEVPLDEITLNCNSHYRYGNSRNEEELAKLLSADTMKEFISYAVGCMFGRYSLDKPGLVLANQGETLKDYLDVIASHTAKQSPNDKEIASGGQRTPERPRNDTGISFMPDEDNAIPVLEGEWFEDDIAERFKKFLRVTFGEEHYDENLAFIEEAIGRDFRSYFVKEFYREHVQMYKKRPIYWMFSSPKGSFNALIYMHRYQPDTVSIVLNNYLREYIKKLTAHKSQLERTSISGSASQSQKTRALKESAKVNKVLAELKEYEDEVLYPLATQRIQIDLDDGVKVNYKKFGKALSPIKGL